MGSASALAILRRLISSHGVLSSRRISRMMSTATMNSSEPPSGPCLMLPPSIDESGSIAYRFRCLANNEEFVQTNKIGGESSEVQLPADINITNDVVFVGSSLGWLGLYNRRNSDLLLSNPIAGRHIKLPPLYTVGVADRLILSSPLSSEEREGDEDELAFMTFGSRRRVAFCSPRRSNDWSLLGGEDSDRAYDSLAYSSRHKRLFCISEEEPTHRISRIECWNVDRHQHQPLTPDWVHEHIEELEFVYNERQRPDRSEFLIECFQMRYLVYAQHSGELFLVVRHINLHAGPSGSLVHKIILPPLRLRGYHYLRTPYKTVDFDVYRIDLERGEVVYMDASLGGLAMFVGINDSFAIPADITGVKPDCVYYTDENRLVEPTRLERTNYGGHDNGIFRYKHKDFHPCCDIYPIQFNKIRKILPLPLWFTPTYL